jgi:hypothetical protein
MVPESTPELDYYRAVEDLFSTLRGVPHVLSPKDFQLVRSWWKDEVPLSAVRTGVAEVFARRRERGEAEPVVSISYCRHAVAAHAKRVAEMRVGAGAPSSDDVAATRLSIERLAERLDASANNARGLRPRAAAVIDRINLEVRAAADTERPLVEEHLYALETSLLVDCFDALEEEDRRRLDDRAQTEAEHMAAGPEARERTFRALRDRLLRTLLELPRLEIEV